MRVAAVVDHFPGTDGEAVIGDRGALETAVDTQVPGAGRTNEIWLDVPSGGDERPSRPSSHGRRSRARGRLPGCAARRGTRRPPRPRHPLALDSAAVVALLLAALGLALTVLSDLRDDRGDLYDLEAQGAEPALLRRIIGLRALVVGVAGLLAGAVAGGAPRASRDPGRLRHRAGPGSGLPLPDIVRFSGRGRAAAVFLLVAAALVALATRRAFRGDRGPARAQEAGA